MKSTVKEFSEIASQQQKDGLNQVVQEFIRCMNESLRGQFDELAAIDSENLRMAESVHRANAKNCG